MEHLQQSCKENECLASHYLTAIPQDLSKLVYIPEETPKNLALVSEDHGHFSDLYEVENVTNSMDLTYLTNSIKLRYEINMTRQPLIKSSF
jgi:hypothetical protein